MKKLGKKLNVIECTIESYSDYICGCNPGTCDAEIDYSTHIHHAGIVLLRDFTYLGK